MRDWVAWHAAYDDPESPLSMRLRLSPQSRIDPKTLGRQQGYVGPKPWELRPDHGD